MVANWVNLRDFWEVFLKVRVKLKLNNDDLHDRKNYSVEGVNDAFSKFD